VNDAWDDMKASPFLSDRSIELLDATGAKKKWAFAVEEPA
jgi:hypothetical protein